MDKFGLGVFLLLLCVSCSSSEVPVYPVTGSVTWQGRPVQGATVLLYPIHPDESGSTGAKRISPLGYTDQAGNFSVSSRGNGDGAPQGDYVVTIELREERLVGEEMVRDGKNLLPMKYAHTKTTPLRCTVIAGENRLPSFDLTSQQKLP
jgi:hypothetical protein